MTWDEYYDKCGEWATSTQISRISQISDFGSSYEVWQVAQDYMDGKAASRLIKKAVAAGVRFTGEEIEEMLYYVDMDCANRALQSAAFPLTEDQIYTFQGIMDDAIVEAAAKSSGVNLNGEDDEIIDAEPIPQETPRERRKRHRKEFWDGAAEVMMVDLFIDEFFKKKK